MKNEEGKRIAGKEVEKGVKKGPVTPESGKTGKRYFIGPPVNENPARHVSRTHPLSAVGVPETQRHSEAEAKRWPFVRSERAQRRRIGRGVEPR